jgi:hypothetical protein
VLGSRDQGLIALGTRQLQVSAWLLPERSRR